MKYVIPTEIKKKLKDKKWRISHLYKIQDKGKQLVTFQPNRAQLHFAANRHSRNLILKSRQLGFTTYEAIDSLDNVLWTPNYKALMISYDKESALELFDDKINLAWENYHDFLRGLYSVDADRSNKLKFGFGDGTYSSIIVRNKGRSGTFNKVHVSEFAKICRESPRKAKEIITGTIPTVPMGGEIDFESTAEGMSGYFHDMFWEAWNRQLEGREPGPTEYKAHFYNWTWDEEEIAKITKVITVKDMEDSKRFAEHQELHKLSNIQITYYYQKWLGLNKDWDALNQEYPTTPEEAFVASTNSIIDAQYIRAQRAYVRKPIKIIDDIQLYEEPRRDHYYSLGADPSEGKGKDDSVFTILDRMTGREVAFYKNNAIQPDQFGRKIVFAAKLFNNALIVPEINSHGLAMLNEMLSLQYSNVFRQKYYDKAIGEWKQRLGWKTTRLTKPLMVDDFIAAIREDEIGLSSSYTVNQMPSFVHSSEPGSQGMGAEPGKKDDALISAMLAVQGLKDLPSTFKLQ